MAFDPETQFFTQTLYVMSQGPTLSGCIRPVHDRVGNHVEDDRTSGTGMILYESKRLFHGPWCQIHRDTFPDEQGPQTRVEALQQKSFAEVLTVEAHRYKGNITRQGAEDVFQLLLFDALGGGVVDFKDPNAAFKSVDSIGPGIESGPQAHKLFQSPVQTRLQIVVDIAGARDQGSTGKQ